MTNRKLVQRLIGAYAGFVVGVTVLGSSVNLLGSTLNFFTDPTSTQRLAEFDDDGDSVPDLINGPRILEIFRSTPDVFAPLFGRPMMIPGMIRLDDAFEMPGTSTHPAAPAKTEEPTGAFDAVAPKWSSEEIRVSNQFQGGNAAPGMYIVPFASPSSSLPASLMPSPPMPASVSSVSSTASTSSSTTPALTAPPSSTPPVVTAPPSSTPPTASSVSTMSAPPASAAAATTSASMPMMPSSTMEDTTQTSSPMSMDCDLDGESDDICASTCQMYWSDANADGIPDAPAGCS